MHWHLSIQGPRWQCNTNPVWDHLTLIHTYLVFPHVTHVSHVGTNTSWVLTHSSHYFPSTHFNILLIHFTVVHLHQESGHWEVTSTSCQHQWGRTILRIGWDMVSTGHSQQLVQMNWMWGGVLLGCICVCRTANSVMFAVVVVCVCGGGGWTQHCFTRCCVHAFKYKCIVVSMCECIMSCYTNYKTTQGMTHMDRNSSHTIHNILTKHHMWNTVTPYIVQVSELRMLLGKREAHRGTIRCIAKQVCKSLWVWPVRKFPFKLFHHTYVHMVRVGTV